MNSITALLLLVTSASSAPPLLPTPTLDRFVRAERLVNRQSWLLENKPGFGVPISLMVSSAAAAGLGAILIAQSIPKLKTAGTTFSFASGTGFDAISTILLLGIGIIAEIAHLGLGIFGGVRLDSIVKSRAAYDAETERNRTELERLEGAAGS